MEWLVLSIVVCGAATYLVRRFYLVFIESGKGACPACHSGCGGLQNTRKLLETPAVSPEKNPAK